MKAERVLPAPRGSAPGAPGEPPLVRAEGNHEGRLTACHYPEDPSAAARQGTSPWTRP
ncbi:hypothetical protein [Streptomyces sp. SHP 1-2]|uniref:hypothetical protein n=1 Tax=Streptomyces sp. SHP 1-2 TaxID=2769489 RepID=UPI0039E1C640